ncbi:MAG TPA: oxidoreductase [Candidatus Aquilonibacter sp.]|nr:oxidoreductase [Candidatus Aquilonibacter sp.]
MTQAKWTPAAMPPQTGKTVLITGANSGIGFQAARQLARHGAQVLLGVRDIAKGEAARGRILTENPEAQVAVVPLDMASLASIRGFAGEFVSSGGRLDVLVNNAGVMALPKREQTPDGFERQFGTNHLGHFALTGLLIPALLKTETPRVVTVASLAHRNGKMEWDNLQSEKSYTPWGAYNTSKLANILFARELDRRAREQRSRLVSVAVHPGVSQTNIAAHGTDLKTTLFRIFGGWFVQNDEMGALPTLYAATDPAVQGGEYIGPDGRGEVKGYPKVVQPKPQALNEADGRRLWQVSEELTGVVYPALG